MYVWCVTAVFIAISTLYHVYGMYISEIKIYYNNQIPTKFHQLTSVEHFNRKATILSITKTPKDLIYHGPLFYRPRTVSPITSSYGSAIRGHSQMYEENMLGLELGSQFLVRESETTGTLASI